ncbi:GDYXXLXY domain-containing protein [Metabacillus idriensis]|uniref:GDYXXLXY domain-containing protein n=1 Tax=Metabacillus idriensis TaxID=324768 RepID=UPI002813BC39|nr:GDYXXLXY domain-containing protein [Metabacillus idriensis]MDR0137014.1 GDYXXLXY domain-containing protein [Metabacillus idriensis]
MLSKLIPLGYLSAIIFILSGILYFFASNWSGFERLEKVALAIGMMVLFYAASFMSGKILSNREDLPKWLLVGAAVSFGAAAALIGQIYNSHADSYLLFFIWMVPSIALAIITRYQPFAILSYGLLLLTYWFYMFPSSVSINRSDFEEWLIYAGMVILNALVFGLAYFLKLKPLQYASFTAVHLFLIIMSFYDVFEPYSSWMNIVYLAVIMISYFLFMKKDSHHTITIITFVMLGIFALSKYAEVSIRLADKIGPYSFYLFSILGTLLFLGGGIYLAVRVTRRAPDDSLTYKVFKNILIVIITFTSSLLLSFSLGGLLFLIFQSEYSLAVFSLLLIGTAVFWKKLYTAARYTLFITGILTALGVLFMLNAGAAILFIAVSLVIILIERETFLQFLAYTFMLACFISLFFVHLQWMENFRLVLAVLAIAQFLMLLVPVDRVRQLSSFCVFYGFLLLYPAAFWGTDWKETLIYQILYFVLIAAMLTLYHKRESLVKRNITWTFFILFFIGLYYDFAWKLLHKSLTFLLLGLVIFAAVRFFDRERPAGIKIFTNRTWAMIAGVFILQLAFTGYQSFSNEQALEQGKEVVLELQPLDPRSMLQGDYVQLQYEAGRFKPADDTESGTVFTVKVKKDSNGIYRPTGEMAEGRAGDVFKKPQADEAYLTGKYNGYDGLIFGIESFFVEEGTGLELERTAKYAKVIVSDEGNALLVDVKSDLSLLK